MFDRITRRWYHIYEKMNIDLIEARFLSVRTARPLSARDPCGKGKAPKGAGGRPPVFPGRTLKKCPAVIRGFDGELSLLLVKLVHIHFLPL